jgi:hypothetical protein
MKQIVISQQLRERVEELLDELNYLQVTPDDWKAITTNALRNHAENEITDEVIESEIEIYYNA